MSSKNTEPSSTNSSSEQTKPKFRTKFILIVILLANFMRGFGTNVVSIGLPNHIIILGGTLTSYGLILGIFQVFQAIFQTPTSLLSDKLGRRKLILIGMTIYIIGTILCGFATTIPQMIIFRIIQGIGAFSSVLMSVIGDITKGEIRKSAISYYFFSLTSGFLFGTIFGGFFTDLLGVEGTFFLSAGLTFISFLILFIFLPETSPKLQTLELNNAKSSDDLENPNSKLSWMERIKFMRSKGFYGGILTMVIKSGTMSGVTAYTIWVLSIDYKLSSIHLSLVIIPLIIIYTIGLLLVPKISRKVGSVRLISLSFILNFFLLGIIILNPILEIYLTITFIAYFFFGLLDPTITNFTLNFVPTQFRGLGTGVFQTGLFMASALGQILIPKIGDLTNFQITYSVLAGLCLLAWVSIEILKRGNK